LISFLNIGSFSSYEADDLLEDEIFSIFFKTAIPSLEAVGINVFSFYF
jgi:hypothetical protein